MEPMPQQVPNSQLVSIQGSRIVVIRPVHHMSPDEALIHAAWLVALAAPFASTKFSEVLEAVQNT